MKVFINFFWFVYRLLHHKSSDWYVTSEEANRRENICLNCPLLNTKGLLVKLKGPRCSICGCFIEYKRKYKYEICPDKISRW